MADYLPHKRGKLAIETIGFATELETFTHRFVGDPEQLMAIEGTVGDLEPKGMGIEVTGTFFIPETSHAYSQITKAWHTFKRVTVILWIGNMKIVAKGRFNAPECAEDGTKFNFTFIGTDPKITYS